jgi:hypothetical protein
MNAPHPNRFAAYLRRNGLTRASIAAQGTTEEHAKTWAREVRQRLAVKFLQQRIDSLNHDKH